jgi:hypothetical protein
MVSQEGRRDAAMRNVIVCETPPGFHTSLGRGNPCTLAKGKDAGFALLELFGKESGMVPVFVSF